MKNLDKEKMRGKTGVMKKAIGQWILITAIFFFNFQKSFSQITNSYTSNGTYIWTCPPGVTSVNVQCWGAGGAGGGVSSSGNGGAGGAGGSYASTNAISVTPGNNYTVTVGKGGTGSTGNGNSGGNSWFVSAGTILATGGAGGQANNNGNPGLGSTSGCIGTTVYKGGDGISGNSANNGGIYNYGAGGGGAGSTGNGGSATTTSGLGTAVGGGNGGNYLSSSGNGLSGAAAGGGGSGAYTSGSTNYIGGSGADGRVDITYYLSPTITSFTPSSGCGYSTSVVITGTNFTGATAVTFGGTNAGSFTVNSNTQITATAGAGTTGTIAVTTPGGTATSASTFTFSAVPNITGVTICQGGSGSLSSSTTCSSLGPYTSGPNDAGSGASGGGAGSNWGNTNRIYSYNNSYANSNINKNSPNFSDPLNATNYSFSIPSNAIIGGVQVTIGRYAQNSNSLEDNTVQLIIGGSAAGSNYAATSTFWPTSNTPATYGSSSDLWGNTLTAAIINASNFGVTLSANNSGSSNTNAYVDYVEITVTYTIPGTLDWYTVSSGGSSIGSGSPFDPVGVAGSGLTDTNTPGIYTYYAECNASPGCRAAANFTINTTPTISGTLTICAGSTSQLTGSGTPAASNPWVSSVPGVATVNSTGLVIAVSAGTSIITYTNNSGCSITASITVNPIPTTTGVAVCQGGSGSLSSSTTCSSLGPYTSGPNDAGSGASGGGAGSNWGNTNRIYSYNNSYANSNINKNSPNFSDPLNATNYSFSIPSNAIIGGVQVTIGRYAQNSNSLEDNTVQLIIGGSAAGSNYAATSTFWPTSNTPATYGSSSDLWGNTLTAAIINASNFGVTLSANNSGSSNTNAYVDYVEITVTYTIPGTLDWYTVSSGGSSIGSGSPFNPVGVPGSGLTNTNTPGVTTYYAECSSVPGCRAATNFTIGAPIVIPQIPTTNLIAYYKFNGNANDVTGNDNGTLQNSPTSTTDRYGSSNAAYSFNGGSQYVSTANSYASPGPANFTLSIWFKTSTSSGGKLMGFGSSQTGSSGSYDRHLYMNNAGQIYFGVYPGSVVTINSPSSYNDNNWHLATATLSSTSGMALYIDGALVASNGSNKTAQSFTGYWRIGYDNLASWTSAPTSYYFNGTLDDAIIYSTALNATQVAYLYNSPDGAGNNGPVCAGSSLNLTGATLSGATYSWTGPNSFSSSSQNPTFSYTAANAGVYTLVISSSGCSANAYTSVSSLSTPGQWTGNISNNWNNANNWCSGTLPLISTNVNIPGAATNMPIVTDNQVSNNLVINTGASLNINSGGTLQIAGTISNSGTFDASNGTIEMSGTAAQTIPAGSLHNNALMNLIVNNTNGSGVSLGGPLDIYGSVTYSGTGKVLNTNDNLTFKSSSSATAWLGSMTGNTINGKATVERYISAQKGWRFLSVPTNTTQTIQQAWQEGCGANANCVPGFGTQITGAAGTGGGFDVATSAPSLKTYNSATNTWVGVANTNSTNITANYGYLVFVRGDRSVTSAFASATPTILRTKGNLYAGSQPAINISANQFGSIGNPYPSALDMRSISKTGLKDFFYVWDPKLGSSNGYGGYQTFTNSGANYTVTPGGGSYGSSGSSNNYIQSGQAFLLQATGSGGSITLTEAAKTSGSALVSSPVAPPSASLTVNLYGVNPDNSTYMADGFLVNYGDNYSNLVDDMDAIKSTNSSENLGISRDYNLLVIERRHSLTAADTIFFNLTSAKVQNYQFVITASQLYKPGLTGYFADNYLGTQTPLNIDGTTTVSFNIANIPGSYAANRFEIVFTPSQVLPVTFASVVAYQQDNGNIIDWKVSNESNVKQYEVEKSSDGSTFATLKVTPPTANNGGSASYEAIDAQPFKGVNYYRINSVDINGKATYSQIVKVQPAVSLKSDITVYPNPLQDGTINLQFVNQASGAYTIRVIDQLGQPVIIKQIMLSAGSGTETIQLQKSMAHGVYQVEISGPDNSKKMIKVIN